MVTPYYQDDAVTIYHGDCREITPALGARVGLILTDPPFFMPVQHYSSRKDWQRSWGDTSILASWWESTVDVLLGSLRDDGHFVTFCDGQSYPVFFPGLYRRFDTLNSLVWDKGAIGMGRNWRHAHELLIAARWAESYWDGSSASDVLRCKSTPSANRLHPVDKPVALLGQILRPALPADGVLLDPFAGAGSTLAAAKSCGRRAIGVEIEERYCEIAARRMGQEVLDLGGVA